MIINAHQLIVEHFIECECAPCTRCTHNTPTLFSFVASERKMIWEERKTLTRLCIQISAKAIRFSMICTYLLNVFDFGINKMIKAWTLSHPKREKKSFRRSSKRTIFSNFAHYYGWTKVSGLACATILIGFIFSFYFWFKLFLDGKIIHIVFVFVLFDWKGVVMHENRVPDWKRLKYENKLHRIFEYGLKQPNCFSNRLCYFSPSD